MPNGPTSSTSRHITWQQLQERISEGVPFVHRVPGPLPGVPALDIRISEGGQRLALRLPSPSSAISLSPLAEIEISLIHTEDGDMVEIGTHSSYLYQEIYNFFVSVIDKVQLNSIDPITALNETIEGWRELLRSKVTLSDEVQLGLWAELHVLRRFVSLLGDAALLSWTGPQRQPHDFRLGLIEIEVKAARGLKHRHIINGLGQLEPTPNHVLVVYSLCLAPAGLAGTTLPDEIEATSALLQPVGRERFRKILRDHFGYRREHSIYYGQRWQIANTPMIVHVDEFCPRLTKTLLGPVPHKEQIDDVQYRTNLDGLGFEEMSAEATALFSNHLEIAKKLK